MGRHSGGGQTADHHAQWGGVARQAGERTGRENQRRHRRCRYRQGRTPFRPCRPLRAARVRPLRSGQAPAQAVSVREALPTPDHGGTVAPGGTGKSSLEMVEGVSMATGRNLLGEEPRERVRVWYHNGEDNMDELNRRLAAICQYYDIPLEELPGWFFMTSGTRCRSGSRRATAT